MTGDNFTIPSDIFESRVVMAAQMARVNYSILHCASGLVRLFLLSAENLLPDEMVARYIIYSIW